MTTRRSFIKKTALASAGASFAFSASSYGRILGSNDRVNCAVIGVNSRGMAHISAIRQVNKNLNLTALCDVDKGVFSRVAKEFPGLDFKTVKTFGDYRRVLESKQIDAVTIATPDHWHAPMAIQSLQAGKHVYVEKPCCHSIEEGEWLIKVQKDTGKTLQVGNQQRSAPTSIKGVQAILHGIIGEPYMAKCWYSNARNTIGFGKEVAVPDWLDWELWQGPAPRTTFKDNFVHYHWHWFWRWGTGEINNNGLHELDIARWALGVDVPEKVSSEGGRFHFQDDWEFYDTQVASFHFGNKLITWEGRSCNGQPFFGRGRGVMIHGTKGTMLLDRNGTELYDIWGKLLSEEKEAALSATTDTVGIGNLDVLHMENFQNAVVKGEPLNSPIEDVVHSHTICHLGNIAQKTGRTLKLENGKLINDPEAAALWSRTYEPGWEPRV